MGGQDKEGGSRSWGGIDGVRLECKQEKGEQEQTLFKDLLRDDGREQRESY